MAINFGLQCDTWDQTYAMIEPPNGKCLVCGSQSFSEYVIHPVNDMSEAGSLSDEELDDWRRALEHCHDDINLAFVEGEIATRFINTSPKER